MPVRVVAADSVTCLDAGHAGQVLVCGSHGGLIAAWYAARARVRAVVFNDAGRGRDDAGVAGLSALEPLGIAAAAVSHRSARIGDAGDTLESGVISIANGPAAKAGVVVGMRCTEAAPALCAATWRQGELAASDSARVLLLPGDAARAPVWGLDSIGLVEAGDADAILVIGSHGALHGGDPRTALPVAADAAFFHDAGVGKDDAGIGRLPALAGRGLPAATVAHDSARIGDARSLWESGVLSHANAPAAAGGIAPGMTLRDAVARIRGERR